MTTASSAAELPARHPEAPAPGEPIGSHYHRCFGCGDDHRTGLHMHVSAGDGLSIDAKFTVTEDHQGAPGLAHGGLLTAAFDEALGSLAWLLRKPMVTGRLETEFVRPVPVGTTLYIRATTEKVVGRRIYTRAEGRIGEPSGPVAVRAAAIFVTVPIEHFVKYGRAEDVAAAVARPDIRETAGTFEVNP
jgi:acyl-coenzyme A thioesterase PaaI-like protein